MDGFRQRNAKIARKDDKQKSQKRFVEAIWREKSKNLKSLDKYPKSRKVEKCREKKESKNLEKFRKVKK